MKAAKKHILIVDDDEQILVVWRGALLKYADKWDVEVALNGESALEMVRNNHFDLIVTDLKMPAMSGYELTQSVRKFNKNVAVLWITALPDRDLKYSEVELNVCSCLNKPLSITQIRQAVTEALLTGVNTDTSLINSIR